MNLVKVKMLKPHNGYEAGETVELEPSVADAFVEWARVAEYVDAVPTEPTPPQDKLMRAKGGKMKVVTKGVATGGTPDRVW